MLLRADLFSVEKSAQRIIDYFHSKQQIWGFDKLCQDITYEDLDVNDRIALHSGCIQLNPNIQDRAGRAILIMSETHRQFRTFLNRVSITVLIISLCNGKACGYMCRRYPISGGWIVGWLEYLRASFMLASRGLNVPIQNS